MTAIAVLGWVVTCGLFGGGGWLLARRRARKTSPGLILALLLAAAVGTAISGSQMRILDVFGLQVRMDWAIGSFCICSAVGLLARNRQLRERASA